MGKGDGFRAQMQEPGFARRRDAPSVVSGGKKPDPEVGRFVYLGQKMRASPFLSHLTFTAVGAKFQSTLLDHPYSHVCSGYHRGESWAEGAL